MCVRERREERHKMDWKIEILKKMYITKEITRPLQSRRRVVYIRSPCPFINYDSMTNS